MFNLSKTRMTYYYWITESRTVFIIKTNLRLKLLINDHAFHEIITINDHNYCS